MRPARIWGFASAIGAAACTTKVVEVADTTLTPISCTVGGITVSPATATIPVGGGVRVAVIVRECGKDPVQSAARWFSSDSTIARVDSTGLVVGRKVGTVSIIGKLVVDPTLQGAMIANVVAGGDE